MEIREVAVIGLGTMEVVPEPMEIKRQVFAGLDRHPALVMRLVEVVAAVQTDPATIESFALAPLGAGLAFHAGGSGQ